MPTLPAPALLAVLEDALLRADQLSMDMEDSGASFDLQESIDSARDALRTAIDEVATLV